MGIVFVKTYSNFLRDVEFRQRPLPAGFKERSKKFWVFFRVKETALNAGSVDMLPELSSFLGLEPEAFMALLRKGVGRGRSITGIECLDGLYVHPEALGKVLLRLSLKMRLS